MTWKHGLTRFGLINKKEIKRDEDLRVTYFEVDRRQVRSFKP